MAGNAWVKIKTNKAKYGIQRSAAQDFILSCPNHFLVGNNKVSPAPRTITRNVMVAMMFTNLVCSPVKLLIFVTFNINSTGTNRIRAYKILIIFNLTNFNLSTSLPVIPLPTL